MNNQSMDFLSVLLTISGAFIFTNWIVGSRRRALLVALLGLGLVAALRKSSRTATVTRTDLAPAMPHSLMKAEDAKPAPRPKTAKKADDLTIIEGIGPKMSAALTAAGITTFERLSKTTIDELDTAIRAAGMRLAPSLATWSEQAAYAARGDWDGLKTFQESLVRGRQAD
jgi:predicted flap endonuclease-1-like 5' DNA nuclease